MEMYLRAQNKVELSQQYYHGEDMDSDIEKEGVSVDSNKVKTLLEYQPKRPIITKSDNTFATINDREERAEVIIKKIRNDRKQSNLKTYPWEDLNYTDNTDTVPSSVDKKYQKKTYIVTPARVKEIGASGKATVSSYITVNNYSEPGREQQYGKPSTFIARTPSPITTTRHHCCKFPYKLYPTLNPRTFEREDLQVVQGKPIPGVKNGKLPFSILGRLKEQNSLEKEEKDQPVHQSLYKEAAAAFNAMYDAAKAEAGITIIVTDSYRGYARQARNYDGTEFTAVAGTSNHGWGKAIDVSAGGEAGTIRRNGRRVDPCKDRTGMKRWISLNGDRFGFYWGDAPTESWHFVYVW